MASEGEFRLAILAGVPAAKCHFHGNNKQRAELEFAIEMGIGAIVVDHFGESNCWESFFRVGVSRKS